VSIIEIFTLWGQRKVSYPGEVGPELMVAWDEFCMDANSEGFDKVCAEEIKSWGDDLEAHRYITLQVDANKIDAAFAVPALTATVVLR